MRVRDDAPVGDNRLTQRCAIDFAARQETRMCVDWGLRLKEAVFWHHISEVQICLVECADRSDVFPITFEDKSADVPIFDRYRNDVFSEIEQIALQGFDEHVAVENVNAH